MHYCTSLHSWLPAQSAPRVRPTFALCEERNAPEWQLRGVSVRREDQTMSRLGTAKASGSNSPMLIALSVPRTVVVTVTGMLLVALVVTVTLVL